MGSGPPPEMLWINFIVNNHIAILNYWLIADYKIVTFDFFNSI